jgi:hypothetical protein
MLQRKTKKITFKIHRAGSIPALVTKTKAND